MPTLHFTVHCLAPALSFLAPLLTFASDVAVAQVRARLVMEAVADPQWLRDNLEVFADNGIGGFVHSSNFYTSGDRLGVAGTTNPWGENLECVLGLPRERSEQYRMHHFLRAQMGAAPGGCMPWWEDDTAWGKSYRGDDVALPNEKEETFLEQVGRFAGAIFGFAVRRTTSRKSVTSICGRATFFARF